jgi:hypothetical protein
MDGEDRERLIIIYHAAIRKHDQVGLTVPDMKSEQWCDSTKETRAICEDELERISMNIGARINADCQL